MNILSLFVLIPLLMLLGLWIARNVNQVRGVMVAGSTLLLALAAYLTVSYIGQRHAGATAEMLFTDSIVWYAPLHICYSVGVDGISVVMLLLSAIIVFTGTFASWKLKPLTKEYFHYEIPIAMVEDAGITSTGAVSAGNQLPTLQDEYKEYRIAKKLWNEANSVVSYTINSQGRLFRTSDGKEVELKW